MFQHVLKLIISLQNGLVPLLFNLYINDLALSINALGKGITLNNDKLSLFMYADDIVLIAENENDLQSMLKELTR